MIKKKSENDSIEKEKNWKMDFFKKNYLALLLNLVLQVNLEIFQLDSLFSPNL